MNGHIIYPSAATWRSRYQVALSQAAAIVSPAVPWDFSCGGDEYRDDEGKTVIDAGCGAPEFTQDFLDAMAETGVPNFPTGARFYAEIPATWVYLGKISE